VNDDAVSLPEIIHALSKRRYFPRYFMAQDERDLASRPTRPDRYVELIRRAGVNAQHDLPVGRGRIRYVFECQGTSPFV
jgi:hypothetical protein